MDDVDVEEERREMGNRMAQASEANVSHSLRVVV